MWGWHRERLSQLRSLELVLLLWLGELFVGLLFVSFKGCGDTSLSLWHNRAWLHEVNRFWQFGHNLVTVVIDVEFHLRVGQRLKSVVAKVP